MKKALFFLFLIYTQSLFSQATSDSNHLIFCTIGVGSYSGESSGGIDGLISFNFQKNRNQWKFRYIGASEFQIFGPRPQENYNDIGVLYGRVANYKNIQLSISGGFGIVAGIKRGNYLNTPVGWFSSQEYEKKQIFTVGIPLEAEINYNPFNFLGFGFAVYANINIVNSFGGINFMMKIGKVKQNQNFIQ